MNTDQRIKYAEAACRKSNISSKQTGQVIAYLLGALLTHFDSTPVIPLSDSRWFRLVQTAIREVK